MVLAYFDAAFPKSVVFQQLPYRSGTPGAGSRPCPSSAASQTFLKAETCLGLTRKEGSSTGYQAFIPWHSAVAVANLTTFFAMANLLSSHFSFAALLIMAAWCLWWTSFRELKSAIIL